MDNYSKGKNEEEEWNKDKLPISNLPEEFIWMHVKAGSKMFNLLEYAINSLKENNAILWSGCGPAIGKTISCAEIMKKRCKGLYQINKICYHKFKEYWTPNRDDLDELVVTREVPTIHILLSKDPLDETEPGYQAPVSRNSFWKSHSDRNKRKENQKRSGPRVDSKKFQAVGLRSNTYKRSNNSSVPVD